MRKSVCGRGSGAFPFRLSKKGKILFACTDMSSRPPPLMVRAMRSHSWASLAWALLPKSKIWTAPQPGRQTPLQQKGDFECTKCMKNSLFAPDCARRRVQRPTAAQRRLLGRRKRELRETNKRLRSEVFIGSPQNGAKRNFVGKRKNDGTV